MKGAARVVCGLFFWIMFLRLGGGGCRGAGGNAGYAFVVIVVKYMLQEVRVLPESAFQIVMLSPKHQVNINAGLV